MNDRDTGALLPLVPFPSKVDAAEGEGILRRDAEIIATKEFQNESNYLSKILRNSTGYTLPVKNEDDGSICQKIVLTKVDEKDFPVNGYHLATSDEDIRIEATSGKGIFYGIQTLLQLLPPAIYGGVPRFNVEWKYPMVKIEDVPRFSWRGAMLDSSRHFWRVEFIKKFIDLLAYHKLNIFHWHLVDDQGWRIEIKKYPRLTSIGAWRKETVFGDPRAKAGGDGIPHGGFYSQDEIRAVVAYAAVRHITVVPEIEMPGHAQAALAAYPEYGSSSVVPEVETGCGIFPHAFSPFDKTFAFLQDILDEVMELFPSPFIHIGGDEVKKEAWLENPKIREWMRGTGIANGEELQSYFIKRIDTYLTNKGRRLVGWDEILEGGLAEGAVVMSWRGIEGGQKAAEESHDVVMSPCTHTYLDHYQSEDRGGEPLAIGDSFLPLEKVYGFEPIPEDLAKSKEKHILGVQGQLWTEYMPTTSQVEYMAFPRLCALAEVAWSDKANRDYASFTKRLKSHLKRLDVLGIHYRH